MDTSYIKSLKTPIAIIGLGKSGNSAHKLLQALTFSKSELITYDDKNNSAQCRTPEELIALNPQTLVVSPGVPLKSSWLQKLISAGAHITSEINLAASMLTTEKVIGVTGSVGKSTVVSLLGVGAKSFAPNSFVGGNLGTPVCDYALELLNGRTKAEWVILELSSFQLENCDRLQLDYSIITYFSPNHLERYESLEDYYRTKLKITGLTKEECLIGSRSQDAVKYSTEARSKTKLVSSESFSHPELLEKSFLLGPHNKDNFALAAEMARICSWPEISFAEMTQYRGLPHRLEFVAELSGVTYINDSKATAMDSVKIAVNGCLENLASDAKLYVLLGGKDKNLPWQELSIFSTNEKVTPVFFGECGEMAREKSSLQGEYFEKLGSAINYSQRRAHVNDVVLLSPGGTSLDEFKNFEERGDFFKTLVLSSVEA